MDIADLLNLSDIYLTNELTIYESSFYMMSRV